MGFPWGSRETIFSDILNTLQVTAKFLLKLLLIDVADYPDSLKRFMTEDLILIHCHNIDTKPSSFSWKLSEESKPKKAHQLWSNGKILIFFDFNEITDCNNLALGPTKGETMQTIFQFLDKRQILRFHSANFSLWGRSYWSNNLHKHHWNFCPKNQILQS